MGPALQDRIAGGDRERRVGVSETGLVVTARDLEAEAMTGPEHIARRPDFDREGRRLTGHKRLGGQVRVERLPRP
jgi:hypothetical protein